MARKMESRSKEFVTAGPWSEGKAVAGFFMEAETIAGAESRKLTFDVTGKADIVGCWETGMLKGFTTQFQTGSYYVVKCLGKNAETKKGRAWAFDVFALDDKAEIAAAVAEWSPALLKEAIQEKL